MVNGRFRFLHVADLHLDSPFAGLRSAPPRVADVVQQATLLTYDRVVETAIREQVDFVLIAGDVYDGRDRSLRAQLRFCDGLARLARSGIQSFVVFGNHDPLDGWSARIEWPVRAHRFGADSVEAVPVVRDGIRLATIYGISHGHREVRANIAQQIRGNGEAGLAIGLLHANVEGIGGHENYAPCRLEDLEAAGMDYWALGHVHSKRVLREASPLVVYPGNTQARSRAEAGERYCCLVSADATGLSYEMLPVDAIRWYQDRIPITGLAGDQELLDRLDGRCHEIEEESEGRPVICSLTLTGAGDLHQNLSRPGYLDALLERLRGEHGEADPFVYVDRLRVETTPEFDRDERKQAQDFVAALLGVVDAIRSDPDAVAELARELGPLQEQIRKTLGTELPLDSGNLLPWLERAEAMCLDLLEGGRS
ncbi:MAG: metallophosphoesterase [Armatimonadota bacterium]